LTSFQSFLRLKRLNSLNFNVFLVWSRVGVSRCQTLFTWPRCYCVADYWCQVLFNHQVSCSYRLHGFQRCVSCSEFECCSWVKTFICQAPLCLSPVN